MDVRTKKTMSQIIATSSVAKRVMLQFIMRYHGPTPQSGGVQCAVTKVVKTLSVAQILTISIVADTKRPRTEHTQRVQYTHPLSMGVDKLRSSGLTHRRHRQFLDSGLDLLILLQPRKGRREFRLRVSIPSKLYRRSQKGTAPSRSQLNACSRVVASY